MEKTDTFPWSKLAKQTFDLVKRISPELKEKSSVPYLCALTIHVIENGDTCLPIAEVASTTLNNYLKRTDELFEQSVPGKDYSFPCSETIKEEIKKAATLIAFHNSKDASTPLRPFIYSNDRLYTRRNFLYEKNIRTYLSKSITIPKEEIDFSGIEEIPYTSQEQQNAIKTMARNRFSVLSGGPGTGKTTTFSKALLFGLKANPTLQIAICAPTGKAAQRMKESIKKSKNDPNYPTSLKPFLDQIPSEAQTIHSLLKPNKDGTFTYNKDNHIPFDWLVVDESSMISLPLFSRLLDSLNENTRLTLVGDRFQLSSVERGKVFGDISTMPSLKGCISELTVNFRAGLSSPLTLLGKAVNEQDTHTLFSLLNSTDNASQIRFHDHSDIATKDKWPCFKETVQQCLAPFAKAKTPKEALDAISRFIILTPLRRGLYGVEELNNTISGYIRELNPNHPTPVIVLKNNKSLGVSNGDIGVIMANEPGTIYFPDENGRLFSRSKILIPEIEKAYALTIHKSQGSEYQTVAVILPDKSSSPLLTKEILYTGITRAKATLHIWSSPESIETCINTPTTRASGLLQ